MKKYTHFFLFMLFSSAILAQDFRHPAGDSTSNFTVTDSHTYFDSGGIECDLDRGLAASNGSYHRNTASTAIICPDVPGFVVTIEFLEVDIETFTVIPCSDYLTIYNGNSTDAPILFTGCGEEGFDNCADPGDPGDGQDAGGIEGGPNDINASSSGMPANANNIWTSSDVTGCLTVHFASDDFIQDGGWVATVSQAQAPVEIPTLGQWGVIILSLMFGIFGVLFLINHSRSKKKHLGYK